MVWLVRYIVPEALEALAAARRAKSSSLRCVLVGWCVPQTTRPGLLTHTYDIYMLDV